MKMTVSHAALRRLALAAAVSFAIAFILLNRPLASHGATTVHTVTAQAKYPITHIIIIDKENRSFDSMFGLFPGQTARIPQLSRQVERFPWDTRRTACCWMLGMRARQRRWR